MLVAVNVGAALAVRRGRVRGVLLGASAVVLIGAIGFTTLDGGSPGWLPLVLMGVLGLGMGPALSVLQIAIARTTAPGDLGAAMGTLLLGRQLVGTVALSAAAALWTGRVADGPAAATGWAVAVVAGAGAVVAAGALVGVRVAADAEPRAARPVGVGR